MVKSPTTVVARLTSGLINIQLLWPRFRPCYFGDSSDFSSFRLAGQEFGKVNAEERAVDRDDAGDREMNDLASGRLAENDSADPGGNTGSQLLNGGVYAHESAAMTSLDAAGHEGHRRNKPAGHTNHQQ